MTAAERVKQATNDAERVRLATFVAALAACSFGVLAFVPSVLALGSLLGAGQGGDFPDWLPAWMALYAGLPFGIVACIASAMWNRDKDHHHVADSFLALSGLLLGILGILAWLALWYLFITVTFT